MPRYMVVKGAAERYPIDHVFEDTGLNRLRTVARTTGMSIADIKDQVDRMDGMTIEEILRDPDLLDGIAAFVWLTRTAAGETMTLDEAGAIDIGDLDFTSDEEPEAEADPTAAADAPAAPLPTSPTRSGGAKSRATSSKR